MFYYKILYSIYAQWYIGIYFINLIGKMNLTTVLIWIVLFSHPYTPFAFSFSDLTIISFTHFLVEYLTLSLSNFCSNLFTVIFYIQISKRLTWFLMDMCVEPIMLFQSIEVYEIALFHLSLTNVQQLNTLLYFTNLKSALVSQYNSLPIRTKKVNKILTSFCNIFSCQYADIILIFIYKVVVYCICFLVNRCDINPTPQVLSQA